MTGREGRQPAAAGSVIAERYRLVAPLGQGGMGTVWHAEHMTLHSPVAVKLISEESMASEAARARFMREAQSAASLRSPHVVQILDHGIDNGVPYIAMELMEGESLADRLARLGRLSPEATLRVITHVARAAARAHDAGIVHRDLKPDNIFLVENDEEEVAKVLDFGIAKALSPGTESGATTRTGAVMGTPYYMSPEQLRGSKDVDSRADLWSIGVIAFECLCGERPFVSDTFADLVLRICSLPPPKPSDTTALPDGFDAWFARAVAHEPAKRFKDAKSMARALREALGDSASLPADDPPTLVAAARTGTPETLAGTEHHPATGEGPAGRRRAGLLIGGVLVAAGLLAFAATRGGAPAPAPAPEAASMAAAPPKVEIAPLAGADPVAPAADAAVASEPTSASAKLPAPSLTPAPAKAASPPSKKPTTSGAAKPPIAKPEKPPATVAQPPAKPGPPKVDLGI